MKLMKTHHLAALALVVSLVMLGMTTTSGAAQVTSLDFKDSQVAEPFQEIQPGVYLYWQWWNESSENWNMTSYWDGNWQYWYTIQAMNGSSYLISATGSGTYDYEWDFSNLLVSIIVDPDASYVTWLSTFEGQWDVWMIYWAPDPSALTGDEVFVYSGFYYSYWYYYCSYWEEYIWYNEQMEVVDPHAIVPLLGEDYSWASMFADPWNYTDTYEYRGFGYDVSEMVLRADKTEWMDHYFSGLSVFNDTNNNGIMDIVYDEYSYDFDNNGTPDYTYYSVNTTLSERKYEFYSSSAVLGDVVTPFINDDGQIQWSAEVVDIDGVLTESYPVYMLAERGYSDTAMAPFVEPIEYIEIPASVESMKMTYRFELTEDAVILKIDQYIGDFTDPVSGEILPEAEGLSLALNYWSSFSSYEVTAWTTEVPVTVEPGSTGGATTIQPGLPEAGPVSELLVPEGDLFLDLSGDFLDIDFGGTYVWGLDGNTYQVGTAVYPQMMGGYSDMMGAPASSDLTSGQPSDITGGQSWSYASYYYSSCYSNWDGHSITHDPVFRIYPDVGSGAVSGFISMILTSSVLLGSAGVVMIGVIFTLVRKERATRLE